MKYEIFFGRAASRAYGALASGYPLHHLRALRVRTRGAHSPRALGGSATIPLAFARFAGN
jgi:hypothetical protein